MAALAPPPHPPPSSLLGGKQRQRRSTHSLVFLFTAGRATPTPHLLRLRSRSTPAAISTVAGQVAFDAPASAGDLSVLIPISTVLLMVYWVANFVVPEMISKDLQSGEPSEDMPGETSAKVDEIHEKVAMPRQPTEQANKLRGSKGSRR